MTELESATCPRCGNYAPMIPMVFGLPTTETFEAAERGDVVLGGCILYGEDPTHRCSACGREVIVDALRDTNAGAQMIGDGLAERTGRGDGR